MRKILWILLFFLGQNVFCQEYYFDTFLEYEKSKNETDVFMINSFNQEYVFYCYHISNELEGKIIDHKNNIMHFYSIKSVNNSLEFKYIYSQKRDFKKEPCTVKTEKYEVKKVEIDSLNQSFEIIEFKNKKKKRVYENATINLIKIDSKPLPIIAYGYFHHFPICSLIDFPKGFIPKNIQINYFNNEDNKINLIQNKKINTLLSLKPEDIKYN